MIDPGEFQRSPSLARPTGIEGLIAIITVGFIIGLLSGLTGLGGGILLVPVLVAGFGLTQSAAQGVSLIVIIPTVFVGALAHYRRGNVDVASAKFMMCAGVPAAVIGSIFAVDLRRDAAQRMEDLINEPSR